MDHFTHAVHNNIGLCLGKDLVKLFGVRKVNLISCLTYFLQCVSIATKLRRALLSIERTEVGYVKFGHRLVLWIKLMKGTRNLELVPVFFQILSSKLFDRIIKYFALEFYTTFVESQFNLILFWCSTPLFYINFRWKLTTLKSRWIVL